MECFVAYFVNRCVGRVHLGGNEAGVVVIIGDDLADYFVVDVDDFVVHIGLMLLPEGVTIKLGISNATGI